MTAQEYGQWALNLADPLPGGDSDGDGLENLVEYLLGLSPGDPETVSAIEGGLDGNVVFLEYRRYMGTQGVTGKVVWKTDFNDGLPWSEVGITDQLIEDKDGYELRRASLPWSPGDARKFLRLEVNSSSD